MLDNSYNYLFRFIDLFATYEKFKEKMNMYMFNTQIDSSNDEIMYKLHNLLFYRYKGYFFRWTNESTIYNEVALRVQPLIDKNKLLEETISNIERVLEDVALAEDFDRENIVDESIETYENYKTSQNKNTSQSGRSKLILKENIIEQKKLFNDFINSFRTLFRLHKDEIVINNIYNKGG